MVARDRFKYRFKLSGLRLNSPPFPGKCLTIDGKTDFKVAFLADSNVNSIFLSFWRNEALSTYFSICVSDGKILREEQLLIERRRRCCYEMGKECRKDLYEH